MKIGRLFSELRRRHVLRVAAAYAVVAWLVIQVAEATFPAPPRSCSRPRKGLLGWIVAALLRAHVILLPCFRHTSFAEAQIPS